VKEFFNFKKNSQQEIEKWLKSVGLNNSILGKRLGEVSAGQFQRIMIAWSLIDNPDVLLFDEPTSGIDVGGEETIYNLLSRIEKEVNLTIILITHDLSVVYKLADNVLCLNKKLVCYGSPQQALSEKSLHQLYGEEINIYKHDHA